MKKNSEKELYAQLYDVRVPDWDGEINFYKELIGCSPLKAQGVLEIACGTGRIALQLAKDGIEITGLDISSEMLKIAREKSIGLSNTNWVLGDLMDFEIGKKFGFVISPGHSFQFMTTPDEQVMCLEQIKRHLVPDGLAVIHIDFQDFNWLAGLLAQKEPVFEKSNILIHPTTNEKFRPYFAWEFESSTQTATVTAIYEQVNENGDVIQVWKMQPARLHCIFPFEMEHMLKRAGFSIEAVYGDFFKNKLSRDSDQMIWLVKNNVG